MSIIADVSSEGFQETSSSHSDGEPSLETSAIIFTFDSSPAYFFRLCKSNKLPDARG